ARLSAEDVRKAPPHLMRLDLMDKSAEGGYTKGEGAIWLLLKQHEPVANEAGLLVARLAKEAKNKQAGTMRCLAAAAGMAPHDELEAFNLKKDLVEACVAEEAVSRLMDKALHQDALNTLKGFLSFYRGVLDTTSGYEMSRLLQAYVLQLTAGEPLLYCMQQQIGDDEATIEFLSTLFNNRQQYLHDQIIKAPELFHALVLRAETCAASQRLLKEINGGKKPFPPAIVDLFRKYRTRIPLKPGMWRADLLETLTEEEELEDDKEEPPGGGFITLEKEALGVKLNRIARYLGICALPLGFIVLSLPLHSAACDSPLPMIMLIDGVLLLCLAMLCVVFVTQAQLMSKRATFVVFPLALVLFAGHCVLWVLLLWMSFGSLG
ncbi:unnamed protein product, partial [Chrysoparadoxa australica]